MPKLQSLLEAVARAILDSGVPLPEPPTPLGDSMLAVARRIHSSTQAALSDADIRAALREAVSGPPETVELSLRDAIAELTVDFPDLDSRALTAYLDLISPIARQVLRRPDDPAGGSVPEQLALRSIEDWLPLLPDRLSRFHPGDKPEDFDNRRLTDLRGFGLASETWRGLDEDSGEKTLSSLKFITEPTLRQSMPRLADLFQSVLDRDPIVGMVPLKSAYLLTDPPCLEWNYISGYDLAGLIRDWGWRCHKSKPDQALMIVRKVAKVVGKLHTSAEPMVHRGLKPTNILLHPTSDGKVTTWVSDLGWAAISSAYALKHQGDAQTRRQVRRGAHAALYCSPQQRIASKPDPRDDVFALGVVWYQMLKRDLTAIPPTDADWAREYRKDGFSESQAMLMHACMSPDPMQRPANAMVLAELLGSVGAPAKAAKTSRIRGASATMKVEPPAGPIAPARLDETLPAATAQEPTSQFPGSE